MNRMIMGLSDDYGEENDDRWRYISSDRNYEDEYNTEAPVWTNSPWDPYNKDSSDDTYTYGDVKYR